MENYKHTYPLTILEQHLDTFGHVNHANYLVLYEEARWDWITERGYGLKKILETGLGPVILEVQISYKRELQVRQKIIIESQVKSHKQLISLIHQEMKDETGRVYSMIDLKFGFFDLKARKLITPNREWLNALGLSEEGLS